MPFSLKCLSKLHHQALTLTQDEVRAALSHTDLDQMWLRDLRPLLVTRYPSSAGSQAVQAVSLQKTQLAHSQSSNIYLKKAKSMCATFYSHVFFVCVRSISKQPLVPLEQAGK